ncbi:hypothetical protein KUV28_19015 [Ferrimonas balearica]|nr:hypothetical protein [Ferrimonas balearica]
MTEILNIGEIEQWLHERPVETSIQIALRNALRLIPLAHYAAGLPDSNTAMATLACMRACLVSQVALNDRSSVVLGAAYDAHHFARSNMSDRFGSPAVEASAIAAYTVYGRAAHAEAASGLRVFTDHKDRRLRALPLQEPLTELSHVPAFFASADIDQLERGGKLGEVVLPKEVSNFVDGWASYQNNILDRSGPWSFWSRWYERAMAGEAQDWELYERIVTEIPDDVWTGENAVAEVARWIKLLSANRATRIVEPLAKDQDTGEIYIDHDAPLADDLLQFACHRAETALETAITSSRNGLHSGSYVAISIRSAIRSAPDNASLLATSFFDACLSLKQAIKEDILPADAPHQNLCNALFAIVEEICDESEQARKRCARLAGLHPREPVSLEDRKSAPEIAKVAGEISGNEELKQQLQEDAEVIATAENPPRSVRARFTHYTSSIGMLVDKGKVWQKRVEWLWAQISKLADWWPDDWSK